MTHSMLRPCPECRNEVSESATTCPHCGYRLLGREHLVTCPHCKAEVLPETHPHDTISRYCPICKRPVTGLRGRKTFVVVSGIFALGVLIALVALVIYLFSRFGDIAWP